MATLYGLPADGMPSRPHSRLAPRQQQPPQMSGTDFWAKKLGASGGLEPAINAGATTPHVALTEALSTGPTNRRPAEERAEREHAALKEALQNLTSQSGGGSTSSRHIRRHTDSELPPRKRPWRGKVEASRVQVILLLLYLFYY
jgi:hypothetical protein